MVQIIRKVEFSFVEPTEGFQYFHTNTLSVHWFVAFCPCFIVRRLYWYISTYEVIGSGYEVASSGAASVHYPYTHEYRPTNCSSVGIRRICTDYIHIHSSIFLMFGDFQKETRRSAAGTRKKICKRSTQTMQRCNIDASFGRTILFSTD